MLKFYEKELLMKQKQIEFAKLGFVAELECTVAILESVDVDGSHRKALNDLTASLEAILLMFGDIDYCQKRLEELRTVAAEEIAEHARKQTVESLLGDTEVPSADDERYATC